MFRTSRLAMPAVRRALLFLATASVAALLWPAGASASHFEAGGGNSPSDAGAAQLRSTAESETAVAARPSTRPGSWDTE